MHIDWPWNRSLGLFTIYTGIKRPYTIHFFLRTGLDSLIGYEKVVVDEEWTYNSFGLSFLFQINWG